MTWHNKPGVINKIPLANNLPRLKMNGYTKSYPHKHYTWADSYNLSNLFHNEKS